MSTETALPAMTPADNDAPSLLPGRRAAQQAADHNSVKITLPIIGTVTLPPAQQLTYVGGVGVLAVIGVLEWPVAAVLAVGHLLASDSNNKALQNFGAALEEA